MACALLPLKICRVEFFWTKHRIGPSLLKSRFVVTLGVFCGQMLNDRLIAATLTVLVCDNCGLACEATGDSR